MAGRRAIAALASCSMVVVACVGSADPAASDVSQPPSPTAQTEPTHQSPSSEPHTDLTAEPAEAADTTPPPTAGETSTTQAAQPARAGTAVIDLDVRHQSIEGFGVSTRVWSDPHLSDAPQTNVPASAQDEILALLIDDLGLTRMRPIIGAGIELDNDNDDADVLDPTGFNFEGKRTDAHVEVIGQARARGLPVWFPTMLKPERWMSEQNPDEFAERIMAQLFRWQDLDALPPLISPVNEPTLEIAGAFSMEWFVEMVRELGRRIDQAGLATQLIIPDDLAPETGIAFAEAVMADPETRQYIAALGYHLYGGNEVAQQRFAELGSEYGVPVWMTEYSRAEWDSWPAVLDWAAIVHDLLVRNAAGAVDYMWGFFGSYQRGHTLVSIEFDDGQYQSHEPMAAYWITGQWSRFVRPGYVRTEVTAPQGAELSAFVSPDGREVVIVAVNRSAEAVALPMDIAGGPIDGAIQRVRSSDTEQWSESSIEPTSTQGFEDELAPQSVSTFVVPIGP
jgi:O-glycosyl hydrolase